MAVLLNLFYLNLLNIVKNKQPKDRKKIIDKIMTKYQGSHIFEDLAMSSSIEDDDEFDCLSPPKAFERPAGKNKFTLAISTDKEERILNLQRHYKEIFPEDYEEAAKEVPRSKYGRTPLHDAVMDEDENAVREWIAAGNKTSISDNNGHTPLQMADFHGLKEMSELLRSLGTKR